MFLRSRIAVLFPRIGLQGDAVLSAFSMKAFGEQCGEHVSIRSARDHMFKRPEHLRSQLKHKRCNDDFRVNFWNS